MEEVKSLEGYGRLKMGTAECVSDDMIRGDDGVLRFDKRLPGLGGICPVVT